MSDSQMLVVCRSAREPLQFGSELGYSCKGCSAPLQVGAVGRKAIADGGTPLCNSCGLTLAKAVDPKEIEFFVSQAAEEQLREGRASSNPLRDFIERLRKGIS